MDKNILKEIGLSDREIAVYLALHKIGVTTTGPLVKSSEVSNAKIYEILDKLIKKGLATYIFKGKTKYFQATDPKVLLNFFDEKRNALNTIVEELKAIRDKKEPAYESRIYEGIRAIKGAFFEMFDYIGKNSEYCVFPIGEQLAKEEMVQFWAQVFHKRLDMNITVKTLPNKKWKSIFDKFYKKYKKIEIKYTPQQFPTGIFIFKGHILNVVWGEKPVGFLIKSTENYQRWQKFFDEQWENAKN